MPALFAYLIALGLLLGTGYGALNWLAQPEPVKVAAKAKPKSKSPAAYQAPSQEVAQAAPPANKPDESSTATKPSSNEDEGSPVPSDQQASSSSDQQLPPQPQPRVAVANVAAGDQGTSSEAARPAPVIRSANAEISSDESRRSIEQSVKPAVRADPAKHLKTDAPSASAPAVTDRTSAPAATDRTSKRPRSRQLSSHSERRALAVMTLRTIEFPDGRRITQLIPLGGGEPF